MLRTIVTGVLRFTFIYLPRFVLGVVLYLLSLVSRQMGKLGTFVLFRGLPYLPIRLLFPPRTARILRDDFMTVMDGVAETLIEEHFGEGHTREMVSRDLRTRLERGEFVQPEKYNVGEFGVSLLLTFSALGLVYFQIPNGLAEALSLWIAAATIVLIVAVSIRTLLMDLLAYEEPSNGSLIEDTKRFAWNSTILSNLYPISLLQILRFTRFAGDDAYRLTAYSFGVSLERAIREDVPMRNVFLEIFLDGCWRIISGESLPPEVPPAEDFEYLS